jgi:predicted nuclease with TOPRIM domain
LHRENPEMQRIFENVIGNLSEEMKRSKTDKMMLEEAFKNQSNSYDENLKKLYEEMESQMKAEKSKIFSQVSKNTKHK